MNYSPKKGQEESKMDYKHEKQNLQQVKNWWKATAGKHKIEILSEPEPYTVEWEGKVINKVRMDIKVEGEKFSWGVTKGATENSLYGQLVLIGENKGKLEGEKITLIVKGSGKDVEYTVEESLSLMTPKEEKV
jgi:hypothetical protein